MATKKTKYLTGSTPEARLGKDPEKERREAHLARQHSITEDDIFMLDTVKRYSWYIDNALRTKTEELEKAIAQGKESMKHDDGNSVYRSMEAMLGQCEWALKDYQQAWKALKEAGVE